MANTTTAMAMAAALLAVGASAPDDPIAFEDPLERRASRIAVDAAHLVYSERVGDRSRIVTRARSGDHWQAPVAVFDAPSGTVAFASAISPDGQHLYFESNARTPAVPGREDSDVWVMEWQSGAWRDARSLAAAYATPYNAHAPTVDEHGTLCFNSTRPGGLGRNDIYCGRPDEAPVLVAVLNSPQQDASATLAASGESIVFASDRPGGLGGWDLYIAQRRGHEWLPPRNLGAPVNSAADETGPSLWSKGGRLYFLRATPGSQATPQVFSVAFEERAAQH